MRLFTRSRPVRAAAASVLAATLTLSLGGCQSPFGAGAALTMDGSDPCRGQRAEFAGSKTYFQDKIATGALTGAALGAGAGILYGLARGRVDVGTVAVGALAGGVVGAGSAYYSTLAERARDQSEMANTMNQDLARETQEIDHSVASFARLRACRFGQAQIVKGQARRRELDRPTALQRIAFHRDRFDEEIRTAREFGLTMARRGEQFQQAANDLRTKPVSKPGWSPAPPARIASVNRAASVSVPEKRATFDRSIASAERESKTAFNLDGGASLSWLGVVGPDA